MNVSFRVKITNVPSEYSKWACWWIWRSLPTPEGSFGPRVLISQTYEISDVPDTGQMQLILYSEARDVSRQVPYYPSTMVVKNGATYIYDFQANTLIEAPVEASKFPIIPVVIGGIILAVLAVAVRRKR